jgi:tetratricopeptide (TPR) repeat protein
VTANAAPSDLPDDAVVACAVEQFRAMTFPAPEGGIVTVTYPIAFAPEGATLPPAEVPESRTASSPPKAPALSGPLGEVLQAIGEQRVSDAVAKATAWHVKEPGEVLALVALGRAYEAARVPEQAARAYGSIIDLYPWRADQRRFAGGHLERLGTADALGLALDSYRVAQEQRPDHPSSHRMLAMAWLAKGEPAKAFDVLQAALARRYPDGRFAGVERVLREDLGLAAAAWLRAEPKRADEILARLHAAGGEMDTKASIRFVLSWETDANDVDLHVYDAVGGHAYYGDRSLGSGGDLYADVTTGYGPECFTVQGPRKDRTPSYRLKVQYYAQGPMGYGMGKVQIVRHDGRGGLRFEERPFVIMNGGSEADLGSVEI